MKKVWLVIGTDTEDAGDDSNIVVVFDEPKKAQDYIDELLIEDKTEDEDYSTYHFEIQEKKVN